MENNKQKQSLKANKIKEYFSTKTSEQIFSLCLLIGIVALMLFCCIVRLCGVLWFTADFSRIQEPSKIWQEVIKGTLLIFELLFVYKLLCRTKWWICFIIAVTETGLGILLGETINNEIVSNLFYMACMFIIPLPFVKHWFSLIDTAVVYGLGLLYGLLFMVGRIGTFESNAYNFIVSVIGIIDYKLFMVALYLIINYFGGIQLWKTQKRLILQKDLCKTSASKIQ